MARSPISSLPDTEQVSAFNQNFNFTHKTSVEFAMHGHAPTRPIIVEFSNFPRRDGKLKHSCRYENSLRGSKCLSHCNTVGDPQKILI